MFVPLSNEIDQAFREDGNLPRKLLGAVIVGLGIGLPFTLERNLGRAPGDPDRASLFECACVTAMAAAACVILVLCMCLKDVVRRRMRDGEPVNFVLRLYLASGRWSLALWLATAIIAACALVVYWP